MTECIIDLQSLEGLGNDVKVERWCKMKRDGEERHLIGMNLDR